MKNMLMKWLAMPAAAIVILTASGCNSEMKRLVIDQLFGVATAITSAGVTSLVQMLLGTTAQ